jgi:hypothetical protein
VNAEDVALAEYGELKAEQRDRIKARDGYMYTTLAAVFIVAGASAQAHLPVLLLALTPVCAVLSWARLRNDLRVTALRDYFRDVTARLLADPATPVLAWESRPRQRTHKWLQLGADLVTFVLPGIVGYTVVLVAHPTGLVILAGGFNGFITGVTATAIISYADLGGRRG